MLVEIDPRPHEDGARKRKLRVAIANLLVASISLLALSGCSLGWRAGAGLTANSAGSISGQLFVESHFGMGPIDSGVDVAGSVRDKPTHGTFGADYTLAYRDEDDDDDDSGPSWRAGIYGGIRGVFGGGTVGEGHAGGLLDLLPRIARGDEGVHHFGSGLELGLSSLFKGGRVLGEVTTRLFYEWESKTYGPIY